MFVVKRKNMAFKFFFSFVMSAATSQFRFPKFSTKPLLSTITINYSDDDDVDVVVEDHYDDNDDDDFFLRYHLSSHHQTFCQ